MTATQDFLKAILPPITMGAFGPDQHYFVFALRGTYKQQESVASLAQLEASCKRYSDAGYNAYMALSAFDSTTQKRSAANARLVKSLWADLDIGKAGCDYQNQTEALTVLVEFSKKTGLAPSFVVSSGKGLHVYWALDKAIPANEWKALATGFFYLCRDSGLQVDSSRARDLSSVLRMPGTIHQKTGNEVTILTATGKVYTPDIISSKFSAPVAPESVAVPRAPITKAAKLMDYVPEAPYYDGVVIARNCNQIMTMGSQLYPNWFNAMSVLRRCKNGLEVAQALSANHPERSYTPEKTIEKFYAAAEDDPSHCARFREHNPDGCKGCKFLNKITSPACIYKLVRSSQAKIAKPIKIEGEHLTLPDWDSSLGRVGLNDKDDNSGFTVSDRGIVWHHYDTKNDVEEDVLIFRTKLYYLRGEVYIDDLKRPHRVHIFEVERPTEQCDHVAFDCDKDCGPQNVMKWCMNAGLIPATPRCDGRVMNNMINAYLAKVELDPRERTSYDHLGWQDITDPMTKEKHKGFVTGSGAVTGSGLQAVAFGGIAKASIPKMCSHAGDIHNWKYIPQMYRVLDQKAGQLAMCFSFAAPLMEIGGGDAGNCILSIWSDKTGCGKSQLLRSCASVWGNPNELFFSKDESVTARCRRLAILNNLPACMDEVTDMSDEDLSNLAFVVASGKEKNKLRASGAEFIKTGRWATCTYLTANKSVKECLARYHTDTSATLQRIMEYKCDFKQFTDQTTREYIQACAKKYTENYGIAGVEFMMKLMQHPERLLSLRDYVNTWSLQNKFKQEERYMSTALALAIKAGRWAVEFGLLDYDMDKLETWVLSKFVMYNRHMTASSETDWLSSFGDALLDMSLNTLVVKSAKRRKEDADPGNDFMPDKYILVRPKRDVAVRYEVEERELYVSRKAFGIWCKDNHASPSTVISTLKRKGILLEEAKLNLCRCISTLPSARIKAWRIKKESLDMIGYIAPEAPKTPQNTQEK